MQLSKEYAVSEILGVLLENSNIDSNTELDIEGVYFKLGDLLDIKYITILSELAKFADEQILYCMEKLIENNINVGALDI